MTNVFCLWLWQIWGAIKKIEEEAGNKVWYKTRSIQELPEEGTIIDVMHTSIMYVGNGENFFESIIDAVNKYKPKRIINHWTVPVGTMDKLKEMLWQEVYHSPVNGKHPDLYVSIKYIFTKVCSSQWCAEYLQSIWIKKTHVMPPREAELSKLLITTAYGWDILFAKIVWKMCEEEGLDYNEVYTNMTKIYNEGYRALGEEQFTRPILKPTPGRIWGHCISENIELLPEWAKEFADIFRSLNH